VDVVRHDRRQSQIAGQFVEQVVGRVVEGLAVVDQLHGDVAVPEPVDQPHQIGPRRGRAVLGERAADRAFAAAGEDDDVSGQLVDHFFEVVGGAAFLAAGDLGVGDDAAESCREHVCDALSTARAELARIIQRRSEVSGFGTCVGWCRYASRSAVPRPRRSCATNAAPRPATPVCGTGPAPAR
jgi:hypothetical protein